MRKRIFDIIQIGNKEDLPSRAFDYIIVGSICLNILALFLETFSELAFLLPVFHVIEIVTMVFFIIEYILRIWTADYLYPRVGKAKARLKFIISFDGVVDLLTIIPAFFLAGFIVFRMLRVVRIFRLFRINSQYDSFNIITNVLLKKKNQIISSIFIILILMFASSLGMYNAEHEAQPEAFANAFSGIWWSVSTLLTVGYGDIYPVTVVGRIMAIIIAFLGVGVVAIPTGIISAGFVEQYTKDSHSDEKLLDIAEIGEVLADDKSEFIGKSIAEIKREFNISIYMVLRGGLTIVATDNLIVEQNDVLIVQSERIVKKQKKQAKRL